MFVKRIIEQLQNYNHRFQISVYLLRKFIRRQKTCFEKYVFKMSQRVIVRVDRIPEGPHKTFFLTVFWMGFQFLSLTLFVVLFILRPHTMFH